MNQKEYELIAGVLRDKDYNWRSVTSGAMARKVGDRLIEAFADTLTAEYPNFDREKFMIAAGIGDAAE